MARHPSNPTRFDAYPSGVKARVRTGRAGSSSVIWSEPFDSRLHLQHDAQGHVCVLALQDADWAEYDPRHCEEADGTLLSEDYYLQVLDILA